MFSYLANSIKFNVLAFLIALLLLILDVKAGNVGPAILDGVGVIIFSLLIFSNVVERINLWEDRDY